MRKPDDAWRRRSGFSDTADGRSNIRHRADRSETPAPGDLSAGFYAPIGPVTRDRYGEIVEPEPEPPARVAPYTAEPAIPPVSPAVQGWAKTYGDAFAVELEAARFLSPAELEARLDACKIVAEGRRRRADG